MSTTWAEVSCEVPAAMVDLLADFLVELSGNGVTIENIALDTFSLETLENTPVKAVTAYFPADLQLNEKVARLSAYLETVGPGYEGFILQQPRVTYLQEEDWANNWKTHFKPARIGRRLVIAPTWEEVAISEGDIILRLDPGMAFGTGTHPTTRLCLEAVERIFSPEGPPSRSASLPPRDFLDVGTGTGILAIAAAKLGAQKVVAIDIDPDAVEVARENFSLNGVTGDFLVASTPLEEISGDFDVVAANILAEELARLAFPLLDRLRPGGVLVLSGILTEKEDIVVGAFDRSGLDLTTTRLEEWSCLCYRREA